MAIINKNENLDNVVEALAARIVIEWNPRDDSGSVMFHFERFDRRISDWYVNVREWLGTLNAPIREIAADSYTYVHPVTGEETTIDGGDVLAMVKAVADRRWQLSQAPTAVSENSDSGAG